MGAQGAAMIRWIYKGSPAEPGVWESADGRFNIDPLYEGTVRPRSYKLTQRATLRTSRDYPDGLHVDLDKLVTVGTSTHDTVRHAKAHAALLDR
jgi:hypothetical protein